MAKIDISKVDCCDACFEEYSSPDKRRNSFIQVSINHKTIKLCKHHAKMLKDELCSYEELEDIMNDSIIPYGTKIIYRGTNGQSNRKCYCGHYNEEDDTYNIYNGWDLCHIPKKDIVVCEWI